MGVCLHKLRQANGKRVLEGEWVVSRAVSNDWAF
jgi:hypothetical protein